MHPLWSLLLRGKRTETEPNSASEKPKKQPVDKYGGRVRSITGDGDIQTTEALVRQVADRIQGVIESKLTFPPIPYIPVLPTAYPGFNYSTPTYYPTPYTNANTPQVGYNIIHTPQSGYQVRNNTPQVGCNIVNTPQGNIIPRNVSDSATNNTSSPRIIDEKRRCWICNDEEHFACDCPSGAVKAPISKSHSNG